MHVTQEDIQGLSDLEVTTLVDSFNEQLDAFAPPHRALVHRFTHALVEALRERRRVEADQES